MSNPAFIVRTIFHNLDASGAITDTSYGIRVYDDYGNSYSNLVEDFQSLVELSPADLVNMAFDIEHGGSSIVEHVYGHDEPIWVDDVPYLISLNDDELFEVQRLDAGGWLA